MLANRAIWQDLLFSAKIEGGLSDRSASDDPGLLTNFGITRVALANHRGVKIKSITRQDMIDLTLEEAKAIASADYWNPPRCTDMTAGIDIQCADFSFNSSPRQAVRTLQRVLGFSGTDLDGFCGPLTLRAIAARDPRELINAYHEARMNFLRQLPNWDANKNGWSARCQAMRELALRLAPAEAPAAVAKTDKTRRWLASSIAVAGTAVTTMLPDVVSGVVSAMSPAKAAYQQAADLTAPFSVYSTLVTPVIGGLVILGIVFVHVRAARMSRNAAQAGVIAEIGNYDPITAAHSRDVRQPICFL